jgi:hypothetical protein
LSLSFPCHDSAQANTSPWPPSLPSRQRFLLNPQLFHVSALCRTSNVSPSTQNKSKFPHNGLTKPWWSGSPIPQYVLALIIFPISTSCAPGPPAPCFCALARTPPCLLFLGHAQGNSFLSFQSPTGPWSVKSVFLIHKITPNSSSAFPRPLPCFILPHEAYHHLTETIWCVCIGVCVCVNVGNTHTYVICF